MIELVKKNNNLQFTGKTPVDNQLSDTSTNPVQNKVITLKVNEIDEVVRALSKKNIDYIERDEGVYLIFDGFKEGSVDMVLIPIVEQSYNPTSPNAASGVALGEVKDIMTNYIDTNIRPITIPQYRDLWTYEDLREASNTYKNFAFHTRGYNFTGSNTEINLPQGQYVCFQAYGWGGIGCWNLRETKVYYVIFEPVYDNNGKETSCKYLVSCKIDEIEATIGDIDTALDSIIALQESYIGGASE